MKNKLLHIINPGIIVLILAGLFLWPEPAAAGTSEWSAETIPGTEENVIGPANVDVRDIAIGYDETTIYAVPGDSIAGNIIFKSLNAGVSWTTLTVNTRADLVAVAPDDSNIVVFANNSTPELYISLNGGAIWFAMNKPQASGGGAAAYITDIAISPPRNGLRYIIAAGAEAEGTGNLWYFPYGPLGATWQETRDPANGFVPHSEVSAIVFSPDFQSDSTLAAVTANVSTGVKIQLLNITSNKWNTAASYEDYPYTVVSENITRLNSVSITLAPTFNGQDEDTHDIFLGLAIDGDAAAIAASGLYRFSDTKKTKYQISALIHSVAFNGGYLVAGQYNGTVVYRIQNPYSTSPVIKTSITTKSPGGDNRVVVAWLGKNVAAGSGGNESAFSISKDNGNAFNDISLIDTAITKAADVAVSAKAEKVYLVTDDGFDTSVWYKYSNAWTRVFSYKGVTDCIVRAEKQSASAVYIAQKGSQSIYYNASSGGAQWHLRSSILSIQDLSVESSQTIYVLDANGQVTKSTAAGASWGTPSATGLASGNMLYSISSGKLLAGSQDGYVAYSLDGNTSWTKITQQFSTGAGKMQVVPDQSFSSNKVIYAASDTTGQDIKKCVIGGNANWTDIFNGAITGGLYGIAIDSNTLYALEYNAGTQQSTVWRFMMPTTATITSEEWIGITTKTTTDINDATVSLNAAPQALKTSLNKLWAVKTNGTNKLYSFSDFGTNLRVTTISPENNYIGRINSTTGVAEDIGFYWYRPGAATGYELRIATDRDFRSTIATLNIASSDNAVFAMIGPNQAGLRNVAFAPGLTYYWKVRTSTPGIGLFSNVWSFTIQMPIASSLQIIGPSGGMAIQDTTPAFSWEPLAGATEYEFVLSDNMTMAPLILSTRVKTTGIEMDKELERGKTYFWRVRSTNPVQSDWSMMGIFTVEKAVIPPVTLQGTPTITIELPEPLVKTELLLPGENSAPEQQIPFYLIFAIFLGAVLTGAVTVLIIGRPRRIFSKIPSAEGFGPVRISQRQNNHSATAPEKPAEEKAVPLQTAVTSKDAETIIFAARSFLRISSQDKDTADTARDKERETLGKKLAARIQELAKKEPLYFRYPEDTALLLRIWAQFGSRNETNKYLTGSFKTKPENAIRLIKCYLPAGVSPDAKDADERFTTESYKALAEVIDTDKVYAALTKVFKFKPGATAETTAVNPAGRNIAFKFMHLHLQGNNLQ